ncbi:MAG: C45 family peptidase, partial [Actinomycetota bacterium]|nr:C45 family peptidase [Actinomycetota bacterium]
MQFGRAHAAAVHDALASYRQLWGAFGVSVDDARAVGCAVLEPVRDFAPRLSDEMYGIADGSGLPLEDVGALNARTELLALSGHRAEECTTCVHLPRDGSPRTVQTWDWHEEQVDAWFVWSLHHPDGTTVHTLTEYGIVGKIGVSSRGVSVNFNALGHRGDTGMGGVPVHVVARRVLDEAGSVEHAVAVAAEARVTASSSLTVTGRSDASWYDEWSTVVIELHPGGPTVVPAAAASARNPQYVVHTNHFLGLARTEQVHRSGSTTYERQALLTEETAARRPGDRAGLVRLLADHRLGPRGLCAHPVPGAPPGER